MNELYETKPWLEAGPHHFVPGHVYGRRQPSLVVTLRASRQIEHTLTDWTPLQATAALLQVWRETTNSEQVLAEPLGWPDEWGAWVHRLGACTVSLLQGAGLSVFEPPSALRLPKPTEIDSAWTTLLLPVQPGRPIATWRAWEFTLQIFNSWIRAREGVSQKDQLEQALQSLRILAPQGGNTPRFLRAAYDLGVPVTALNLETFQYGQGRYAQWMQSTFTPLTSNIASGLARDKPTAAARLRQAGLPVPAHHPVGEVEEAVQAAKQLGYPVVVKPADRDGGECVAVGLETDDQVRAAFAAARQLSRLVLVEKHISARDYRLTVLDGKLLWAIERIPAGVTGDGMHTIEQLIANENADPKRGDGPHSPLKRLQLDTDALQLLHNQGLTPEAVPTQGRFVALRRIANVATGGRPVAVNEQVHPDNARLAERAAEALRLDLAGIDLLIPDIARSWRETGAAIVEVNAQPQLGATTGPHLYGEILKRRLENKGRIPVIAVFGAAPDDFLAEALANRLMEAGFCVGWSDLRGICIAGEWLSQGRPSTFAAGQLLLTHPRIEALVFSIHDDEMLRLGLPVDEIDWLVLAGANITFHQSSKDQGERSVQTLFSELWATLSPACVERVVNLHGSNVVVSSSDAASKGCVVQPMDHEELLVSLDERFGIARSSNCADIVSRACLGDDVISRTVVAPSNPPESRAFSCQSAG